MNPWRWVDPRVRSVRVADLRAYLLGRGWKVRPSPNPDTLLFEEPPVEGGEPFLQAVPSSEGFSDYPRHIAELLTTLSEIEDRHPVELLDEILRQSERKPSEARPGQDGAGPTAALPSNGPSPRRRRRTRPA
jgi:hypothetical protein